MPSPKTNPATQPFQPVLNYRVPRSAPLAERLRRLPRPSWLTLCLLLFTAAAAYWLHADHAPWVVTRRFDGASPHNSPDAAISPNGKQLVTILDDHQTLRIYDIATGRTIRDFHRPAGEATTANFSPDATRLWSIGTDSQGILWETSTGKALASLPVDDLFPQIFGSATASPFSSDGKWVVAWDEHTTRICDGHAGAIQAELAPDDYIQFPIFSPDGRYLAGIGPNAREVRIFETTTWRRVSAFSVGGGQSGMGGHNLAFTPDSKLLIAACCPSVHIWDAATNRVSTAFTVVGQLEGCCLSPNGRYLLTRNANGPEEIWDMATRTLHARIGNEFGGWAMISPDGTRIAGNRGIAAFPSLDLLGENNTQNDRIAWLPGSNAFVSAPWPSASRPIYSTLVQRRRPEAPYGVAWLPQFWLLVLAGLISAWSLQRDFRRWRAAPPFARP